MNLRKLKVNLDAVRQAEEEDGLNHDSVRLGSLLVSSRGLTTSSSSSGVYGLTVKDLVLVTERSDQLLGKGSSGSVWRAVNRRTGRAVALKEVQVTSSARQNEIRRELETLYNVESPASSHMVDFYGAFYHEGAVFIAMECLDGTLDRLPHPIPLLVLASMARSVLHGLSYLHRQRHLIHRDIKPSNVLYSRATGELKVSDFGISSHLDGTSDNAHTFVGTLTYMSPERLKGEQYSYAADVWSFGLVVAEMALGTSPYQHLQGTTTETRFWALLQHINSDAPVVELPDTVDATLADFIHACLRKDPQQRPTCEELLEHPFLYNVQPESQDKIRIRDWLAEVHPSSASVSSSSSTQSGELPGSKTRKMAHNAAAAAAAAAATITTGSNDSQCECRGCGRGGGSLQPTPSPCVSRGSASSPWLQQQQQQYVEPIASPSSSSAAAEGRISLPNADITPQPRFEEVEMTGSPASVVSSLSLDEELQRLVAVQRARTVSKKS